MGAHADQGVPPPPPPGSGIPPPPVRACRALGAHAAVREGPPRHPGLARTLWLRAVCPPPPPACARCVRAAWVGEGPPRPICPRPSRTGGSRAGVIGGHFPCPRCTPWARAAGWGVPLPSPPRQPLALGACDRLGGGLVFVSPPSGSCDLSARWDTPSGSGSLSGGGYRAAVFGKSPPCPHCAPWVPAAGWGSPLPLPPLAGCLC